MNFPIVIVVTQSEKVLFVFGTEEKGIPVTSLFLSSRWLGSFCSLKWNLQVTSAAPPGRWCSHPVGCRAAVNADDKWSACGFSLWVFPPQTKQWSRNGAARQPPAWAGNRLTTLRCHLVIFVRHRASASLSAPWWCLKTWKRSPDSKQH